MEEIGKKTSPNADEDPMWVCVGLEETKGSKLSQALGYQEFQVPKMEVLNLMLLVSYYIS